MSVTVRIDPTLCRGHAICALFFSDGVELDQWGFGRVVDDVVDSTRLLKRARRAAAACPNGAFIIADDAAAPAAGVDATV
ncbi:MAG TPA: ferredoxin [Acidimicrobiales bacterium]